MRIGIIVPSLHGGGAEFVARTWAAALSSRGHYVAVYSYARLNDDRELPAGVVRRHSGLKDSHGLVRYPLIVRWLRRQAHSDNLDVVVCMLTSSNLVGIASLGLRNRSGRPSVVISERNVATPYLPLEGRSGRIQLALATALYRFADGGIAISHPVAAEMVTRFGLPSRRVFVVPNPVLADEQSTTEESRPKLIRVGFVGRLVEQKQPSRFVDVLGELARRGHTVEGVVIGEGPLRGPMDEAGSAHGVKLKFLGWREPWTDARAEMDCLLLPSSIEGFGNVLIEAASSGLPVAASSSALGVADAVVPGVTGALALSCDSGDLADAVEEALAIANPPDVSSWLQRFTVSSSVTRLEAVLERLYSADPTGR